MATVTRVEFVNFSGQQVEAWQFEGLVVPRAGDLVSLKGAVYLIDAIKWETTPGWNRAKVRVAPAPTLTW
jgi:hypothetical protein